MTKKIYLLPLFGLIGFLCINMGDGTYSRCVTGTQPEGFSLKEGKSSYTALVSDGKSYKRRRVSQLCFRDSTYTDTARNEGDVFLKVKEDDSDIEEKIYLNKIKSMELVPKAGCRLCASEKKQGQLFFWLKVTFLNGVSREYTANPEVALSFRVPETGGEGVAYLHKIDKIENIRLETQPMVEPPLPHVDEEKEEVEKEAPKKKLLPLPELPEMPDIGM